MKAIIYAGVGLFSIASIYGVSDYYSSQKNGSLNKLYQEEIETIGALPKMVVPVISADKKDVVFKKEENTSKDLALTNTKNKFTRVIDLADFSRGRIMPSRVRDTAYTIEDITPLEEIKLDTVAKVTIDQ